MSSKFRYNGFLWKHLIAADNRELVKRELSETPRNKNLQKTLEFYQIVTPGVPYSRLNSHKVTVYQITQPQWGSHGSFYVPYGKLELLLELDMGEEMQIAMTGFKEVTLQENAKHVFLDGSVITGPRTKIVAGESKLSEAEKYFEIRQDLTDRRKDEGTFNYDFRIKKKIINYSKPLEIHIESYSKIEDVFWYSSKEIALVSKTELRRSQYLLKLIYRKTSPNK